jgi:hypothetical protein
MFRGMEIAFWQNMSWLNLLRIVVAAVGFCSPLVCPAWAQEEFNQPAEAGQDTDSWSGSSPETSFDIREDIKKAKELLGSRRSGYTVSIEKATVLVRGRRGRMRVKVVKRRIIEPAFLLAVENLNERKLSLVRYTRSGCQTRGFDVVKIRSNGVASRFEIRYPENMAVLALRTMVHCEEKGYEEVVYTPYSPAIDTRQVREDGLNYLKGQIESARADLEEKNVPLNGLKGLDYISGDVAPTEISLVLSIIEHIDPLRFKHSPPGGETLLVHEVLTIIGANMGDAYAYSRSPAGARGLFQFIPGTYEMILRKYREAGLDRNFVSGCSNHTNAAKASLLLFDSDLSDLPEDYLRSVGADVESVGQYLAAAYNCGSRRVERSLRACTDGWTCLLPEETKTYLKKFDAVWRIRESLDR